MIKWKGFPHRHNLAFVSLIGILLSIISALWAFLLSIAETENKNFAVVSLSMALGFLIVPLALFLQYGTCPKNQILHSIKIK